MHRDGWGLLCLIVLAIALIVVAIFGVLSPPAKADEAHMHLYHADAQSDEWMRSLQRPDGQGTCCSLNDCRPTDADWRDGQWWAVIAGKSMPIPPGKVVKSPLSIDGEAWVCSMGVTIFCFIPPLLGN